MLTVMACCLVSRSCANTTTPPGGGPKDTIPPVIVKVTPEANALNFPLVGGKVALTFDEYTVIKTATDILLSPPSQKKPIAKVKGKNIVVTMQDTLMPDRTYTIDFGQALADNNEGNPAPRYVYTFSTGNEIDSMYITGRVIECQSLKPVPKVLVAAYHNRPDSACFNSFPDAATRTDDWGFFSMRNIKPVEYRIIAFTDEDGDSKYNPDADQVAFLDGTFKPQAVVNDTIYELQGYDMKDTAKCEARVPMMELSYFKELQSVQYLQNSGRISEKFGFLKFSAGNVDIRKMDFYGIDSSEVLVQYNPARDSLNFWITSKYHLEDSVLLNVTYMKTDSTGVLVETDEMVSMGMPTDSVLLKNIKDHEKDTTFKFRLTTTNETVEQNGIVLECDTPIRDIVLDSLKFIETNPKNQTFERKLIFKKDTTDIRRFILLPEDKLTIGYTYNLTIPQGAFINIYDLPNAQETAKIELPNDENLSSISLDVKGVDTRYIVELVSDKKDKVYRTFTVDCDTVLHCPYLQKENYSIRVTQDSNRNGIFDMGNLLERRQPEKVAIFKFEDGKDVIELPERTDLDQEIFIKNLFK